MGGVRGGGGGGGGLESNGPDKAEVAPAPEAMDSRFFFIAPSNRVLLHTAASSASCGCAGICRNTAAERRAATAVAAVAGAEAFFRAQRKPSDVSMIEIHPGGRSTRALTRWSRGR